MTQEELSALLGIVVSLIFSYFPVVNIWFDALEGNVKRLLQVALALVVTIAIFVLSCFDILSAFACTWDGALVALRLVVAFLITNQTAYKLTPK